MHEVKVESGEIEETKGTEGGETEGTEGTEGQSWCFGGKTER